MNQSFSKILIGAIIILVLAGGIFTWQYFRSPKKSILNGKSYKKLPDKIDEEHLLQALQKEKDRISEIQTYGKRVKGIFEKWKMEEVATGQEVIMEQIFMQETHARKVYENRVYGFTVRYPYELDDELESGFVPLLFNAASPGLSLTPSTIAFYPPSSPLENLLDFDPFSSSDFILSEREVVLNNYQAVIKKAATPSIWPTAVIPFYSLL